MLFHDLKSGQTHLEDVILNDGSKTRAHITSKIEQISDGLTERAYKEHVLNSVFFPEIDLRRDQVEPAHKRTYHWILDDPAGNTLSWTNFNQWLRRGSGIFWV